MIAPDGQLDRPALRRVVFSEAKELEALNDLVHPEVERLLKARVAEARTRGDAMVICDIPLLFEKKMADRFDKIVLVDAPRPLRLERMVKERGLREAEAMKIIAAQMPADLKRARADYVIDNGGTLSDLTRKVDDLWAELNQAVAGRR